MPLKDSEKERAYQKAYSATHRDVAKARAKKWRQNHPDVVRSRDRRAYNEAYNKAYRAKRRADPILREIDKVRNGATERVRLDKRHTDPLIREADRLVKSAYNKAYHKKRRANPVLWETYIASIKARRTVISEQWFATAGAVCRDCGCADKRFLTFAHLKDDGAEDRKKYGNMGWTAYALKHFDPTKYGTQCYNCQRRQELNRRATVLAKRISDQDYVDDSEKANKERTYNRKRNMRQRQRGFLILGGSMCKCCGETDDRVMEFAHTHNNGAQERRELGLWGAFKRIFEHPEDYEILCVNCNVAAEHNDGLCPHRADRATQDQLISAPAFIEEIRMELSGMKIEDSL